MMLMVDVRDKLIYRDSVAKICDFETPSDATIAIIRWDGEAGVIEHDGNEPGDSAIIEAFTDPSIIQPYLDVYDASSPTPTISKAQCLLWLLSVNKTETDIDTLIAAIPDVGDRAVAQIIWKHREPFHRSHPLFDQIGTAIGLSSEQIDDAFRAAALL